MAKYTETEESILLSIDNAYGEDPSPESGRTYCEGEGEYDAGLKLLKRGLLRKVESGTFDGGEVYIHFGLTDKGFKATEKLCA
jgi:hypothetical protein